MKNSIRIFCCLLGFSLLACFPLQTWALQRYDGGLPYDTYIYGQNGEPIGLPAAFAPSGRVTGEQLGIGDFQNPSDVFYDKETARFYVADKGNNRLVILEKDMALLSVVSAFSYEGLDMTLKEPSGVCVRDNKVYVADTGNARVVCFDRESLQCVKIFGRPDIPQLGESYVYQPLKISVDLAGRMYIVAKDVNKGLLLLDGQGGFQAFLGAPEVVVTFWDHFWKAFMTKEQKKGLLKAVPTEYNSVSIDSGGFLYVTTQSEGVPPIARLNTQGENILKYNGEEYPAGDGWFTDVKGIKAASSFVDLAVDEDGGYYGLDASNGRVFAYGPEGQLLYAFGAIGSQQGTFYSPCAIESTGETLVVADTSNGILTTFQRTAFGQDISQAQKEMRLGNYEQAREKLYHVLRQSPSYQAAYVDLGRIDIQQGRYREAMEKLSFADDKDYYSQAFQLYRVEAAGEWFTFLFIGVLLLAALIAAMVVVKRKTRVYDRVLAVPIVRDLHYSTYCMFHPFDGFWDVKREKRGNLRTANLLMIAFVVLYALRTQMSGYLFLSAPREEINVLMELARVVLPLLLWCVSNWCFTTLMDGEGTLKDIYIATAYSLKPYILLALPLFLLSHVLSLEESFIYAALDSIVWLWVLALLFFGMMTTQDYSMKKAVLTTGLTLIGICLMIFLGLVFTNIVQDFISFIYDGYRELMYRFY